MNLIKIVDGLAPSGIPHGDHSKVHVKKEPCGEFKAGFKNALGNKKDTGEDFSPEELGATRESVLGRKSRPELREEPEESLSEQKLSSNHSDSHAQIDPDRRNSNFSQDFAEEGTSDKAAAKKQHNTSTPSLCSFPKKEFAGVPVIISEDSSYSVVTPQPIHSQEKPVLSSEKKDSSFSSKVVPETVLDNVIIAKPTLIGDDPSNRNIFTVPPRIIPETVLDNTIVTTQALTSSEPIVLSKPAQNSSDNVVIAKPAQNSSDNVVIAKPVQTSNTPLTSSDQKESSNEIRPSLISEKTFVHKEDRSSYSKEEIVIAANSKTIVVSKQDERISNDKTLSDALTKASLATFEHPENPARSEPKTSSESSQRTLTDTSKNKKSSQDRLDTSYVIPANHEIAQALASTTRSEKATSPYAISARAEKQEKSVLEAKPATISDEHQTNEDSEASAQTPLFYGTEKSSIPVRKETSDETFSFQPTDFSDAQKRHFQPSLTKKRDPANPFDGNKEQKRVLNQLERLSISLDKSNQKEMAPSNEDEKKLTFSNDFSQLNSQEENESNLANHSMSQQTLSNDEALSSSSKKLAVSIKETHLSSIENREETDSFDFESDLFSSEAAASTSHDFKPSPTPHVIHPSMVANTAQTTAVETPVRMDTQTAVNLVAELVQQINQANFGDRTETLITLQNPPMFDGAQIMIREFKQAAGEFSVSFHGLSPQAAALLVERTNQRLLQDGFERRGLTVHIFQVSQARVTETYFTSGEQNGTFKEKDRDGKGKQEKGSGGQRDPRYG